MSAHRMAVVWAGLIQLGAPALAASHDARTPRALQAEDASDDEQDEPADGGWEKEGEADGDEEESEWVKVDAAAPPAAPRVAVPPVALPMRAVGLGTAGLGAALMVRGLMLRLELKNDVIALSEEYGGLPDELPSDIARLQTQTNTFLWSGLAVSALGGGLIMMNPPASQTTSMGLHVGWSRQW